MEEELLMNGIEDVLYQFCLKFVARKYLLITIHLVRQALMFHPKLEDFKITKIIFK